MARTNRPLGNQARSVELLWGTRRQPARGPKPTLSRARIARAAIQIADADGLAAVSMHRVAGTLNVTKMSLYRYVPGKAELIVLMVDTAAGEPHVDGRSRDWRAQLNDWARQLLTVFRRHIWILDATIGPRVMGPRELDWMECAVAALEGTGLDGGERMDAVVVIAGHIRTIAQQSGSATRKRQTNTEEQMGKALAELMRTHGTRYPAISAAITSAMKHGSQYKALDFGLERILDGLGVLIDQRSNTRAGVENPA